MVDGSPEPTLTEEIEALFSRLSEPDHEVARATDRLLHRLRSLVNRFEQSLARYQLLFEEAPDAYVVTDEFGTITEANRAARSLLADDDRPLVGLGLGSLVLDDERPEFDHWLTQLRNGAQEIRWEALFDLAPEPVPIEIQLADDLREIGYRWALRDQRARAATERQLRDSVREEQERAELLDAQSKAQSEFLVALAHDLRAPIGALVHQAQLLGRDDLDAGLRRRSSKALEDNAGLVSQLLEDLIDIERSASENVAPQLRASALATLIDEVIDDNVDVRLPDGLSVLTDEAIARRALRRLIRASRGSTDAQLHITASALPDSIEITIANRSTVADEFDVPGDGVDVRLAEALLALVGGSVRNAKRGSELAVILQRAEEGA